jgi:hypothetical protein
MKQTSRLLERKVRPGMTCSGPTGQGGGVCPAPVEGCALGQSLETLQSTGDDGGRRDSEEQYDGA